PVRPSVRRDQARDMGRCDRADHRRLSSPPLYLDACRGSVGPCRHRSARSGVSGMTAAIDVRAVEKRFGNVSIIRDLNLTVAPGERHAIIGPNGAGKSTTFNLISGRIAP